MATELRQIDRRSRGELIRIESHVRRIEDIEAWREVRRHGNRIHLAVVAERPDVAEQSAGRLVDLAERRLAQLGGDAA